MLQECELSPHYTVRETLSMFSRYFESPTDVEAVVALVGLVDKAGDRVAQLSGGQKRRLDVGLGLVGDPELLFLDEPTTGLDPSARAMWEMMEGLRDAGKTILLTTHYMDEAEHLADRIIILRQGEIVAQGTSGELRDSLGDVTHIAFRVRTDAPSLTCSAWMADISAHLDGVLVRIASKSVQADLGRALHWADGQALELADLEVVRPTLDDVFVELAEAPPEEVRGQ